MVELGLSSRDAVAMAADIEDLTGVTLSATVAFQHPTIESLATRIIEGEPEVAETTPTTRTGRATADVARHRDRGSGHPVPGRHEHPRRDVAGAAGGPRRDHRSARGPLVGVPRGAADRRAGRQGAHPRRLPRRHQGLRRRVLRAVADRSRQHRPAAADGAGADLGGARARPHPGVELRGEAVGVYIGAHQQRLPVLALSRPERSRTRTRSPATRRSIIANRVSLLLRLPRTVGRRRHRLLVVAGRRAPGCAGAAQRRVPTSRWPAASTCWSPRW